MNKLPLFVRRLIFDFITTALPTLLALQFTGDTASLLHAAALGVGAAAVASAARNLPWLNAWLSEVLELNVSVSASAKLQ